ncbi:MAG: hypothetical protein Q8P02_02185 [Candidatus Micrarchaeota archaeon]|nr:hypothetical protein [Candidatus Micrarchaeota archaeon]
MSFENGFNADAFGGIAWLDPYNGQGEDYGHADFLSGVGATVVFLSGRPAKSPPKLF